LSLVAGERGGQAVNPSPSRPAALYRSPGLRWEGGPRRLGAVSPSG